jgi:hypothetical protein
MRWLHLYAGVDTYRRRDKKYRKAYSRDQDFPSQVQEIYSGLYGHSYMGLDGRRATATLAEFLEKLSRMLPESAETLSHKLNWTSLEYYFASAAYHFQKNHLAYEYKFYSASALTAVNALIDYCDQSEKVPCVLILTTQLPNEYLSDTKAPRDEYDTALRKYKDLFGAKIRDRGSKNLIVERHTLATTNEKRIRYLTPKGRWKFGHGNENLNNRFIPPVKDNLFVKWLRQNHHWRAPGEDQLPSASRAYINVIHRNQLPSDDPKDEDMCIDLIVFGIAEPDNNELKTDWRFGIGVFAAVRPENLQGRFVKFFSPEDLKKNSFPFLGYRVPSFEQLVEALHGKEIIGHDFVRPKRSELLVDMPPWSNWVDTDTKKAVQGKTSRYKYCPGNVVLGPETAGKTWWQELLEEVRETVITARGWAAIVLAFLADIALKLFLGLPWWLLLLIPIAVLTAVITHGRKSISAKRSDHV